MHYNVRIIDKNGNEGYITACYEGGFNFNRSKYAAKDYASYQAALNVAKKMKKIGYDVEILEYYF